MCPPPSDPIRPIGPVAGDVYVERSAFAERVARRRRRGEDGQKPGHGHPHPEDEEPEVPEDWVEVATPLKAAGAYDDHGRTAASEAADDAPHPHIDKTA